jgi:site-specific DNA recombinase
MEGAIAEYERAKILERTRRGKLHKAQRGAPVGGRAPYGYKYILGDKNKRLDGYYEIVPEEAEVVRRIFRLLTRDRMSVRGIAMELTRRGIPPQRGKHWRTSSIHRILRNATYYNCRIRYNWSMSVEPEDGNNGNRYRRRKNVSRRVRPENDWVWIPLPESLRIIDEKTFQQAQRQLGVNGQQSSRNTKHEYLLSKLLKCGNCDSPLYGSSCHGKLYYVCGNRARTFPLKKECPVGAFKAEPLESAVWAKVCDVVADPELILSQMGKMQANARRGQAAAHSELEKMERAIAAAALEEGRLLDAFREKVISMDQLRDQIGKVNEKKTRLAAEKQSILTRLDGGAPATLGRDDAAEYCKLVQKRLAGLNGDFEAKRRILGLLVDKIVVQGKRVRIKGIIPGRSAEDEAQGSSAAIASTTH